MRSTLLYEPLAGKHAVNSWHSRQEAPCIWLHMMPQHTYEAVKLVQDHEHLAQCVFQLSIFFGELVRMGWRRALPPQAQLIEQVPNQILLVHQLLHSSHQSCRT